jgi:hypothetical protein
MLHVELLLIKYGVAAGHKAFDITNHYNPYVPYVRVVLKLRVESNAVYIFKKVLCCAVTYLNPYIKVEIDEDVLTD